jgi:hypothetical protein
VPKKMATLTLAVRQTCAASLMPSHSRTSVLVTGRSKARCSRLLAIWLRPRPRAGLLSRLARLRSDRRFFAMCVTTYSKYPVKKKNWPSRCSAARPSFNLKTAKSLGLDPPGFYKGQIEGFAGFYK